MTCEFLCVKIDLWRGICVWIENICELLWVNVVCSRGWSCLRRNIRILFVLCVGEYCVYLRTPRINWERMKLQRGIYTFGVEGLFWAKIGRGYVFLMYIVCLEYILYIAYTNFVYILYIKDTTFVYNICTSKIQILYTFCTSGIQLLYTIFVHQGYNFCIQFLYIEDTML